MVDGLVLNVKLMRLEPACEPHPDCVSPAACAFPCRWPECRDESKYWSDENSQGHSK